MELIRRPRGLRPYHRPCVATIGAFDGVHLGHLAVIEQLKDEAVRYDLPSTAITFEPLPREYLQPDSAPARLTPLREKFEALVGSGVDRLLVLPFDEQLRAMSARQFAEELLVKGLGIRSLILGDDFRFGREREGDQAFMQSMGEQHGFSVLSTATLELNGERVSSTRLRQMLAEGNFVAAEQLLGRPFTLSGRVIHGRALGRQLGMPTANIALRRQVSPLSGVYAVSVSGGDLVDAPAVANVGTRPTVSGGTRPLLEVHLLEGSPELYGRRLEVTPRAALRREQRFDSLDALRAQIARDSQEARDFFAAA